MDPDPPLARPAPSVIARIVLELDDAALEAWLALIYECEPAPPVREAVADYLREKAGDELNHALWPRFGDGDPDVVTALRLELDGEPIDGGWEPHSGP